MTRRRVVCLSALLGLAAAEANAQLPVGIFSEVPGHPTNVVPDLPGRSFTLFDRPFRSNDGSRWIITATVNTGSTLTDEIVITGQGVHRPTFRLRAQEGVTLINGRTIDTASIDTRISINDSGGYSFTGNLSGATTDDESIITGDDAGILNVAIREGQATGGLPGVNFGLTLDSPSITNGGAVSVRGSSLQNAPPGQTSAACRNGGATVDAQIGKPIGSENWQTLNTSDYYVSADGNRWFIAGDTDGPTTADAIMVHDGNIVIREGSPVAPRFSEGVQTFAENLMMSNGDWFARGSNLSTAQDWVVKNGDVLAATDDPVPGGEPGETFDDAIFSATFFHMAGNNEGDTIYGGTTNLPDPDRDAVLVLNNTRVLLRQGDPVDLDGNGIFDDDAYISVFNNDDGFLTNRDLQGEYDLYFTADLINGAGVALGQSFMALHIPEPATLALLAFGGLALLRRRV